PSGRLNAFAAGSQDAPIIGLTSGLLYRLSAREINGVLAHEIAHLMHDDLRLKAFTQVLSRVSHIMATIGKWILFFSIPAVLAGVMPFPVSILLLLIVVPFMVQVLDLAISRNREWEADATAARLTGDPIGLAAALQKLYRMRLFAGFPFGRARQEMHALPEWLQTHPNIRKRISSLVEMAKTRT
ncbi:MAG: M48 family metalloprotease, partial [Bacteroidota bacterium]